MTSSLFLVCVFVCVDFQANEAIEVPLESSAAGKYAISVQNSRSGPILKWRWRTALKKLRFAISVNFKILSSGTLIAQLARKLTERPSEKVSILCLLSPNINTVRHYMRDHCHAVYNLLNSFRACNQRSVLTQDTIHGCR